LNEKDINVETMNQDNCDLVKKIISDKLSTDADRNKNLGGGKKKLLAFFFILLIFYIIMEHRFQLLLLLNKGKFKDCLF
jgi:hypothetical protein